MNQVLDLGEQCAVLTHGHLKFCGIGLIGRGTARYLYKVRIFIVVFFSNLLIYSVFVFGSLEMGLVQHLMICFGVLFEFVKEMGLKGILTYILFT